MFELALFEPQIPQNTGNIIRLCANTGCKLNLIGKMGFNLDDKRMLRAGLDYAEYADIKLCRSLDDFLEQKADQKILAISTRGKKFYYQHNFKAGDILLFGAETHGLPKDFLNSLGAEDILRIPMQANSRCLNLSNSCAVVTYEAWRQLNFIHAV